TLADDLARVRAVRELMGPEGRIRIDANGGWNLDEAERAIHELGESDLEYVEQPCATVDELAELRYRVKHKGIPIAADESIRKAADPLAVAQAKAADLIVIKAQPLGGIRRALSIVAETGLPAVVSSALDTAIGLSQGAALAASLPELDYDCGLGTASLFADDVADARPVDGSVSAARAIPDAAALASLEASADPRAWRLARLQRCPALLTASAPGSPGETSPDSRCCFLLALREYAPREQETAARAEEPQRTAARSGNGNAKQSSEWREARRPSLRRAAVRPCGPEPRCRRDAIRRDRPHP